jgi:PleD family two-component response regulator
MNIGLIFLAFILFLIADFLLRYFLRKRKENKIKIKREKILSDSLQADFTLESKTLKRVEVDKPKARILCVDDEEVILSSFRKILVLDGYSIDTVETGQEALGLIQSHHYDFVFTD